MPRPSSSSLAVELTPQAVTSRIVTLRGVQVLFDRDLAQFFEVQPIRLREQVKRNIARFPADFMFQLTPDEVAAMVSQNAIPSTESFSFQLTADEWADLKCQSGTSTSADSLRFQSGTLNIPARGQHRI